MLTKHNNGQFLEEIIFSDVTHLARGHEFL